MGLELMVPLAEFYINNPGPGPPQILTPPLPSVIINNGFGFPAGTVTDANRLDWDTVSAAAGFASPPQGVHGMPQMKGTAFYNTPEGGFSESFYQTISGFQNYASMFTCMYTAMQARCRLSVTKSNANCPNPIVPVGIRVEDELAGRDGLTNIVTPAQCPAGFTGVTQGSTPQVPFYADSNIDLDIAAKIMWSSGLARQTTFTYLHGLPVYAFSTSGTSPLAYEASGIGFDRFTTPNSQWVGYLQSYVSILRAQGLGFRSIAGTWNNADGSSGPYATSGVPIYNAAAQQLTIQWTTMPTLGTFVAGQKIRVQMRGWKQFQILNGRWSATVMGTTGPNALVAPYVFGLQINRLVRAYPAGIQPGSVGPIAWTYWIPQLGAQVSGSATQPVGALFTMAADKKMGRPFFQDRGRARNRPQ